MISFVSPYVPHHRANEAENLLKGSYGNSRTNYGIIYVKHSDVVISLQTVSIKGNAGENNRFFP
jgi:hypothetical protein